MGTKPKTARVSSTSAECIPTRGSAPDSAVPAIPNGNLQETELQLRRSEERYRRLFHRNLAGVFISKLEGGLIDCNDSFAQIFGFRSREQMLNGHFDPYFSPDQRARYIARLTSAKTLTNLEMNVRRTDGSDVWVLENVMLLEEDHSGPMILGTLVDIT